MRFRLALSCLMPDFSAGDFGDGAAGGFLLSFFPGGANAARQGFTADAGFAGKDLDEEALAVVGSAFGFDGVFGVTVIAGLKQFLQRGFVIADAGAAMQLVAQGGRGWFE